MINQAPTVRYTASVCEIFFSDFRKKTFSAESQSLQSDSDHRNLIARTCRLMANHIHLPVEIGDVCQFAFDEFSWPGKLDSMESGTGLRWHIALVPRAILYLSLIR